MAYRDKKDIGPSREEIALAKGPFGLAVILIVLGVVAIAALAQWALS
jgi:hypothetical protein